MQVAGRAARHVDGRVILYADRISDAMKYLIDESARRRKIQDDYNTKHKIKPKTVQKTSKDILGTTSVADSMSDLDEVNIKNRRGDDFSSMDKKLAVDLMRHEMIESAENLNFEKAAKLRDEIDILEKELSKIFK